MEKITSGIHNGSTDGEDSGDTRGYDGRDLVRIQPGEIEIIPRDDIGRRKQRLEFYLSQVPDIMAGGKLSIPDGYPKEPAEREAAVRLALTYGAELGLPSISSLRAIYFVNNRPSLHSDGPPAVAYASGLLADKWDDVYGYALIQNIAAGGPLLATFPVSWQGSMQRAAMQAMADAINDPNWLCAIALAWRKGDAMPYVRTYSMVDANKAGLLSKGGGNWQKHTKRMLLARARTFALRDAVPEAFQGLRTIEENQELEPRDTPGPAALSEAARTVDSILADAAKGADMRGAEDTEAVRNRVKGILSTKFRPAGLIKPAWTLCLETMLGGSEPSNAEQWDTAGRFLDGLSIKDPRIAKVDAA